MRDGDIGALVDVAFQRYVGRRPTWVEVRAYINDVRRGKAFPEIVSEIENSSGAKKLRAEEEHAKRYLADLEQRVHSAERDVFWCNQIRALAANAPGRGLSDNLSDGDFIVWAAEFLFGARGAIPEEIEQWERYLDADIARRLLFLKKGLEQHIAHKRANPENLHDSDLAWIMGTTRFVRLKDWEEATKALPRAASRRVVSDVDGPFRHSGQYSVSAIASLYRGRKYLKTFLDNITSQTIFDQSELIIIDADSPEGEQSVIEKYQERFPNIVYKRINYRLGIYEAWNVGISLARGKYLTNTNLDDLRAPNSFELQKDALDRHGFVDVAYQDFYYSFDSSLSFDEVAAIGFKSDVPIVTRHNLLKFNYPHNAPMWRKSLHDEVGLFDTSFKSAGDYEFWLRCADAGKSFFKINTPHVVYFQNPEGISTRPTTAGIEEQHRILRRYSHKLISPELRMSRSAFGSLVGMELKPGEWPSRYDMAQDAIRCLGSNFRQVTEGTTPG